MAKKTSAFALDLGVLLLLSAGCVWASFGSAGFFDTFRDLSMAQEIASGRYFPAVGPPIYNTIHVGPLWYYLLALPTRVGGVEIAIVSMALLSSLKYWLAYWVGWKYAQRTGAITALAATLCFTWGIFESIWLNHASLVCTTLLLLCLACLPYLQSASADQTRSISRSFAVGLCAALCFHAHPTTILAGAAGSLLCLSRPFSVAKTIALLGGFSLPFTSYIVSQFSAGFADFIRFKDFASGIVASETETHFLSRSLKMLLSSVSYGGEAATRLYLWDHPIILPAVILVVLLMASLLVFNIQDASKRGDTRPLKLCLVSIIALVIQCIFLVFVRPETPFWMSWSLFLPIFGLAVIALLPSTNRQVMTIRNSLIGIFFAWTMSVYFNIGMQRENIATVKLEPGEKGLMDIIERVRVIEWIKVGRVYLDQIDEQGKAMCGKSIIRGHLAYFTDQTLYVAPRQECSSIEQLVLGGKHLNGYGEHAYLGYEAFSALAWATPEVRGLWPVQVIQVFSKLEGLKPIERALGELRPPLSGREIIFRAATSESAVLALFQYDGFSEPFVVVTVKCNNTVLNSTYSERFVKIYQPCNAVDNIWEIKILGVEDRIDIFSLKPR